MDKIGVAFQQLRTLFSDLRSAKLKHPPTSDSEDAEGRDTQEAHLERAERMAGNKVSLPWLHW